MNCSDSSRGARSPLHHRHTVPVIIAREYCSFSNHLLRHFVFGQLRKIKYKRSTRFLFAIFDGNASSIAFKRSHGTMQAIPVPSAWDFVVKNGSKIRGNKRGRCHARYRQSKAGERTSAKLIGFRPTTDRARWSHNFMERTPPLISLHAPLTQIFMIIWCTSVGSAREVVIAFNGDLECRWLTAEKTGPA